MFSDWRVTACKSLKNSSPLLLFFFFFTEMSENVTNGEISFLGWKKKTWSISMESSRIGREKPRLLEAAAIVNARTLTKQDYRRSGRVAYLPRKDMEQNTTSHEELSSLRYSFLFSWFLPPPLNHRHPTPPHPTLLTHRSGEVVTALVSHDDALWFESGWWRLIHPVVPKKWFAPTSTETEKGNVARRDADLIAF